MNGKMLRQRIKPWMLPIAMLAGVLLHDYIDSVAFLTPWLIFVMLLVTFCRIDPRHIGFSRMIWMLLGVQIAGAVLVYLAVRPLGLTLAQGLFICVFCPTATAAPVVTGMLGGNVGKLVAYSLVSNVVVAVSAPFLLAWLSVEAVDPVAATAGIMGHVAPLILGPLAVALTMRVLSPRVCHAIAEHQSLSFYLWAVALLIVVGRSVSFIMAEPASRIVDILWLSAGAGGVCVAQFWIGRRIGYRFGDRISGAQGLGQKNTVLAIWLALTYLDPLSSVAPAAYIAWQNTINSAQLYRKARG